MGGTLSGRRTRKEAEAGGQTGGGGGLQEGEDSKEVVLELPVGLVLDVQEMLEEVAEELDLMLEDTCL
jgi:hypothetical protein